MRRIATAIGQIIAVVVSAAIILFLSASALRGVQDLWQRFTTHRDQDSRVAMYPGTATVIFGLNGEINATKTEIAALTPVAATEASTDQGTQVSLLATPVLPPSFTPLPSNTPVLEIATALNVAPLSTLRWRTQQRQRKRPPSRQRQPRCPV